jgi:hypothetical protein
LFARALARNHEEHAGSSFCFANIAAKDEWFAPIGVDRIGQGPTILSRMKSTTRSVTSRPRSKVYIGLALVALVALVPLAFWLPYWLIICAYLLIGVSVALGEPLVDYRYCCNHPELRRTASKGQIPEEDMLYP